MRVKLKVVGGKNDGKEIRIAIPEFVIGRGEEAQLRPNSDLISRRHCSIRIAGSTVTVEDLGSRNGTFINGQKLAGPYEAKSGDILRVGQLQFEMGIDVTEPSLKRPKVDNVASAAVRARDVIGGGGNDELDESVSDWLVEEGTETGAHPRDTTMLGLDETKSILAEAERKAKEKEKLRKSRDSDLSDSSISDATGEKRKKEPGKLPPRPRFSHDSSKVAADDVLRKFFNRR